MAFVRFLTFLVSGVFLCLAAVGGNPDNPFVHSGTLWLGFLLAVVLFLCSLEKNFFLDIICLFGVCFFLQRLFVVALWPEQMDYPILSQTHHDVDAALLFVIMAFAAIGGGWQFCRAWFGRPQLVKPLEGSEVVTIFGKTLSYDALFRYYAPFQLFCAGLQFGLLNLKHVGLPGYIFHPSYGVVMRLTQIFLSATYLLMLPLVASGFSSKTKKLAWVGLLLSCLIGLTATSKGFLLTLFGGFLICQYYSGFRIGKKIALIGIGLLLFVILIYAPIAMSLRSARFEAASGYGFFWSPGDVSSDKVANMMHFSMRMSGLDCLTALFKVGRQAWPPYVSFWGDLVLLLHSFIPQQILPKPDWIPTGYLIPYLFRDYPLPTAETTIAMAESYGGLGTAYLYFGFGGGVLCLFIWSAISTFILFYSKLNRIYKILFFYNFIIIFLQGNEFVGSAVHFYEGCLCLLVGRVLYSFVASRRVLTPAVNV